MHETHFLRNLTYTSLLRLHSLLQPLFSTFANPSYSTLFILNQNALQLRIMMLCRRVGEGRSRVDINDTCVRHGVAAGDCPCVHTHHHHIEIISVLAPPTPPPTAQHICMYTTGAVHTLREIISSVKRVVTTSRLWHIKLQILNWIICTTFQHVSPLKQ
jgi:hypothetical protein